MVCIDFELEDARNFVQGHVKLDFFEEATLSSLVFNGACHSEITLSLGETNKVSVYLNIINLWLNIAQNSSFRIIQNFATGYNEPLDATEEIYSMDAKFENGLIINVIDFRNYRGTISIFDPYETGFVR